MAQPQAQRNGFTHGREQGIYVDEHSARYREVIGRYIPITFEIVDKSRARARSAKKEGEPARARPGPSAKTKARQWWPAGFFFALHVC